MLFLLLFAVSYLTLFISAKPHHQTIKSLLHGRKAGLSGYVGIQNTAAFRQLAPHISYYSDYTPNTPNAHGVKGVGMLWGASGSACSSISSPRLQTFKSMIRKATFPT